jgi:hypothetical protein
MTELPVESRPASAVPGVLMVAAGLACLVGGFAAESPACTFLAVPLLLVGLVLSLTRPPQVEFSLTPKGIDVRRPDPVLIPWDDLEGVATEDTRDPQRSTQFRIYLFHRGGTFTLPARLSVPSDKVYHFLDRQLPPQSADKIPAALREYLDQNRETFGPERVWWFHARPALPRPPRKRAWWLVGALALSAVVWIVAGSGKREHAAWVVLGSLLMLVTIISFFVVLAASQNPNARIAGWRRSGLVIAPVGLALVQGDLQGVMRWDELTRIRYHDAQPSLFATIVGVLLIGWLWFLIRSRAGRHGLVLHFHGGQIRIADIYDRPLPEICHRLESYWQPPRHVGQPSASEGDY